GEDHEVVFLRQLHDLFEHVLRVHGAGRIVRVDDDDGAGAAGDLAADVGEVGEPVGLFVAAVVHGLAAGQAHRGGPEWVIGRRHQYLVAGVEQRLGGQRDHFADAVAEIDVVD